jgi:2'-hydroxyisoflavone reductase
VKLLVLGGSRFVGRAMVTDALARGHAVTTFNRGLVDPDGVPGAEALHGDRERDLAALDGRRWDAVIDTCGYLPHVVRASVEALRGRTGRYLFVSSVSVFEHTDPAGATEHSPVRTMPEAEAATFSAEHYGALKARCEHEVRAGFSERALVVRPGLVAGPGDYTDRFTYWAVRLARGGVAVTPARPEQPVQWIDARDLAEWSVRMLEAGTGGDFNATGPAAPLTLGEFLPRVAAAAGGATRLAPVDAGTLARLNIEPWSDLPLVLPYDGGEDGMARTRIDKAIAHGLTLRPLKETTRDVLAWWRAIDPPRALKAGLTPEREAAVLEAFAGA